MGRTYNVEQHTTRTVSEHGEVLSESTELLEPEKTWHMPKRLNAKYWLEAELLIHKVLYGKEIQLLTICKYSVDESFVMHFTAKQLQEAAQKKGIDVSELSVKNFLRKIRELGVVISPRRGVYNFNPFIFSVPGVKNEHICKMQSHWIELYGEPPLGRDLHRDILEAKDDNSLPKFVDARILAKYL